MWVSLHKASRNAHRGKLGSGRGVGAWPAAWGSPGFEEVAMEIVAELFATSWLRARGVGPVKEEAVSGGSKAVWRRRLAVSLHLIIVCQEAAG